VLVGHAHYDHALDLPYVASHLARDATVLDSLTLAHTLAPLDLPLQLETVNARSATPERRGQWISLAAGRIRALPIESGHPNNYAFIHLWTDELTEDRAKAPIRRSVHSS
jgi:glyoxylase-like metal-dependent hydrolase (beta-lactamase superfamily II)